MNPKSQEIVDAALNLSEADRVVILERLLDSLSPDCADRPDDLWEAELDKRFAEFEQSAGDAVPWSELENRE